MSKRDSYNTHLTLRTCIACNTIRKKEDLLRLCMEQGTSVVIDTEKNGKGRGAYVCNIQCLKKVLNENKLQKAFRRKVKTQKLQEQIRNL